MNGTGKHVGATGNDTNTESTDMTVTSTEIEATLQDAFTPDSLEVVDDSHLHAGHAGAREGRHFTVRIRAPRFEGCSRIARHRLIYDAVQLLIPRGIHALAIEARAPGES